VSSTSAINLWGRAWKLSVKTTVDPGSPVTEVLSQDSWDPEALRMTFEVLQSTLPSPYWFADIAIYNLNDPTMQNLVQNAAWVTLEAGYQFGPHKSTIIWDGPVLQPMYGRPDVVDKVIRFNCVATTPVLANNFVNTSYGPLFSQAQVVEQMIKQTSGNYSQQVSPYADQLMRAKQYPRGKTLFGTWGKYINDIAADNFLSYWIAGGGAHTISELLYKETPVVPKITYSPPLPSGWSQQNPNASIDQSIIGVPMQNPFGVDFTVLLDPRLHVQVPPVAVQLDFTVIDQMKVQLGELFTPLPKGPVLVGQVRHRGDSRGNEWYTDVTGFSPTWAMGLLEGVFNASSQGAAAAQ
jgi:hypothetical protein